MVPVSALSRYSRGLALPLRMLRKLPIVTLAAAAYELWLYKFPGQEEHFLETEGWTKQDCFRDVLGAPKGGFPNCAGFYDWDILPDLPFWRTGYFYINFPSVKFQPNTPYQYPALRFFKQAPETPTPPMPEYVPQTDPFFISALKPDVERRQLPDWQPDWLPFIDPESLPLLRPSPFPEVIPFRELPHRRTNRWRVRRYRREVGPQPSARPREARQPSKFVIGTQGTIKEGPSPRQRPARPGRHKKETKLIAKLGGALGRIVNIVSESDDFIDAIFNALPWQQQRGCKRSPQAKLECLYRHWDKLDGSQALINLVLENLVDLVFGKLGQAMGRAKREVWNAGFGEIVKGPPAST